MQLLIMTATRLYNKTKEQGGNYYTLHHKHNRKFIIVTNNNGLNGACSSVYGSRQEI